MGQKVSQTQSVNRPHGCHRISFDTGNLHQAADGVAGQAQMMLHCYFSRIFNLIDLHGKKLCQSCRCHRTGAAYLGLAAALCAADRCVCFDQIADDASCSQSIDDFFIRQSAMLLHVVQGGWQNAAGAASGRRDDDAAVGIFFTDSIGKCADQTILPGLRALALPALPGGFPLLQGLPQWSASSAARLQSDIL